MHKIKDTNEQFRKSTTVWLYDLNEWSFNMTHHKVMFLCLQDQSGRLPVWSRATGQVSGETVSVPLGGRRQVHLQQGKLLINKWSVTWRERERNSFPSRPAARRFLPQKTFCKDVNVAQKFSTCLCSSFVLHQWVKLLLLLLLSLSFWKADLIPDGWSFQTRCENTKLLN